MRKAWPRSPSSCGSRSSTRRVLMAAGLLPSRAALGCGDRDLPEPGRSAAEEKSRPNIWKTVSSISARLCSRPRGCVTSGRNQGWPSGHRHRLPVPRPRLPTPDRGEGGPLAHPDCHPTGARTLAPKGKGRSPDKGVELRRRTSRL
jgi:hypothetical protein